MPPQNTIKLSVKYFLHYLLHVRVERLVRASFSKTNGHQDSALKPDWFNSFRVSGAFRQSGRFHSWLYKLTPISCLLKAHISLAENQPLFYLNLYEFLPFLKSFTGPKGRTVSHVKDNLFLFGLQKTILTNFSGSKIAMSVGFSLPWNLVVSSYQNTFLHCVNTDFPLCICPPLPTLITSLSPCSSLYRYMVQHTERNGEILSHYKCKY